MKQRQTRQGPSLSELLLPVRPHISDATSQSSTTIWAPGLQTQELAQTLHCMLSSTPLSTPTMPSVGSPLSMSRVQDW